MLEHSLPTISRPAFPLAHLRERLVQARYQRDWSQQELADLLGTTPLNVSRWERGLTSPNPYFRRKLCEVFGKSEVELGLRPDLSPILAQSEQLEEAPARVSLYDPFLPLPAAVPLVGRAALLAELKSRMIGSQTTSLLALYGLPGVGKTVLALELASDAELRACYPDGQLWAALGPQPDLPGLLSRWGQLLGIQEDEAKQLRTLSDWMRTLRATIGIRRLLFVLDDAWSLADALACQVGGPQCAYVLTTRLPQLAQSFALSEAYSVDPLDEEASLDLLRQLAPWAAEQAFEPLRGLVHATGGLPLALSLVGHTLCQQTHDRQPRRLQAVLARLQDRLARLQLEPPHDRAVEMGGRRSLEIVIRGSAEHLTREACQAWGALSLLPARPHTFSEEAALAVSQQGVEALDELSDVGVLEAVGAARYTLHRVLADYGRAQLSHQDVQEVSKRLIAYSLRYAEEFCEHYTTLEREASVLVAGLEACEALSREEELVRLTLALAPFWKARGDHVQAGRWLPRSVEAARRLGREREETRGWLLWGEIALERGDYEQALLNFKQGLTLARRVGDTEQECEGLSGIGRVVYKRGKYAEAERILREGLRLARQQGLVRQQAGLLRALGGVMALQGEREQALACLQEGLTFARQAGDDELVCALLNSLGAIYRTVDTLAQGERYLQDGLTLARQRGYRFWEGLVLTNLGVFAYWKGDHGQAECYARDGLELARRLGNPEWMCGALEVLAEIACVQGEYGRADLLFQDGLGLARQIGNPDYETRMLTRLGMVASARGIYGQARQYLREGLGLARQTGNPEYVCTALIFLGEVDLACGEYERAGQMLEEGIQLARQIERHVQVKDALHILGEMALARGEYEQAEQYLREGLGLAREFDNPEDTTRMLASLGALARVRCDYEQAGSYLREGLQLVRQTQLRPLLCRTLSQWGELALQRGQLEVALESFTKSLEMAPEEARLERALAQYGLARVAAAQGKSEETRSFGAQALRTLESIGNREALQVRHWLASLDQRSMEKDAPST